MRPWLLGALVVVACVGQEETTDGDVIDRVGDAAAYAALETRVLVPEAPLCASGAQSCDLPQGAGGVVTPNGDALVRVAGARAAQIVLVRKGSDSAVAFGREGAGPGEYRAPVEIDLDDDGNVHVFDLFTRRLLRFAPDGTPTATGVAQLPPAPQPVMRFVNGQLWMLSSDNPAAKGDTLPTYVYAVGSGAPAAQLHPLDLRLEAYGLGEFRPMPLTLGATPQFAISADSLVAFSNGTTAEVALYDAAGRLRARGGFRTEGRRVTEADVEAAIARQVRGIPPGQMRDQILQRMRESAARHPGITQLVAFAGGGLWAREAPEADTDSVSWIVFVSGLEAQARVRMGVDDRPVGWNAGRILVARSGADEATTGYWWMRAR